MCVNQVYNCVHYNTCLLLQCTDLFIELNLKNLMNALSKVESKWFTIGIQLNIDHGRLESFENNSRGYCGKSLAKVLNYWLKENTDVAVTWQSIVDVLESDSVCEMSLASEIKTRNCQSTDDGNVKGKRNHIVIIIIL